MLYFAGLLAVVALSCGWAGKIWTLSTTVSVVEEPEGFRISIGVYLANASASALIGLSDGHSSATGFAGFAMFFALFPMAIGQIWTRTGIIRMADDPGSFLAYICLPTAAAVGLALYGLLA